MSELSECYARVTTQFGAAGGFYDPNLGHRGTDYSRSADQWIIAYDDMTIQSIDYGSGLGYSVGLQRMKIGGFAGYAHIKNLQGGRGTVIKKGGRIAQVAGWDDPHGTLWDGPHIHTTQGFVSAYNCSVGIRPLSDPAPTIRIAVATGGTSGGGSVPLPTPKPTKKDDDMSKNSGFIYQVKATNSIVYMIANTDSGFCSEYSAGAGQGLMPPAYNNAVAIAFDTNAFATITESHANVIKHSLTIVDDDPVVIDLNDEDVKALVESISGLGDKS